MIGQFQARPTTLRSIAANRAIWSALDAASAPASALFTLAALVRVLSPFDYGVLVIALAASGLSMAINPAIAAATTKFVSELSSPRDPGGRTIASVITVALMTVAVIDLILLLTTTALRERLALWVFGEIEPALQIGQVLLLAVLAMAIQQIDAVLAAAIRGLERFRRQAIIEIVSKAALTAAVIIVAGHTRSVRWVLIAQSAVYIGSTVVRAIAVRRVLPQGRLFELPRWTEAGSIFKYSGWMWLSALAGVAYTSADRILVGRSLGAAAAGQYNFFVQVTQLVHFVPSSLFAFSFPAFSRIAAHSGPRGDDIAMAYRTYLFTMVAIAVGISATMMLSWPFLMRALSGGLPYGRQRLLPALLGANFLILAVSVVPYYLLLAIGRSKTVSLITSTSMLTALALMFVLVPIYGLEGAAIARLAYGLGALLLLRSAQSVLKHR